MPPSGYSARSADGLVTFLRESVNDLLREVAEKKHASLDAGLAFEVNQIANALAGSDCGEEERALLVLTKAFYENVQEVGQEEALCVARVIVLSIHIDEMGKLTKM